MGRCQGGGREGAGMRWEWGRDGAGAQRQLWDKRGTIVGQGETPKRVVFDDLSCL